MNTLRVVLAFAGCVALVYIAARVIVAYMVIEDRRQARLRIEADLAARRRRS